MALKSNSAVDTSDAQRQRWIGGQFRRSKLARHKTRPRGSGNHGGIICRECERGKRNGKSALRRFGGKSLAKFAIGRNAAGDEQTICAEGFRGSKCLLHQVADHRTLKARDQVERGLRTEIERPLARLWNPRNRR